MANSYLQLTCLLLGDLAKLRPYTTLGEKLGAIYYQAEQERVKKIEIIYSGDLVDKPTKPITLAIIKGFLSVVSESEVNYVNAQLKLNEMGVELIESKTSNLEKYTNLITVNFHRKSNTISLSGTVFAKDSIRIVDFFGYPLDFEPTKHVLALQNIDVPGIIGKVGTLLGEKNVNIGAMQWSRRDAKSNKAVSFVSVDSDVSEEILEKLRNTEGIIKVSKLNF